MRIIMQHTVVANRGSNLAEFSEFAVCWNSLRGKITSSSERRVKVLSFLKSAYLNILALVKYVYDKLRIVLTQ